jgi:HK97 family phage prohead protease
LTDKEIRSCSQPVTTRAADAGGALTGYAAVFNSETVIAGLFREVIKPGAFADAVSRDDVRALYNHDPNFVLGRTTSGTLTLSEDETGLRYDVVPPDTTWANDLMVSVKRGDVSQSSFAFQVTEQRWIDASKRGELPTREILKVALFDVSPVTYPAYDATSESLDVQPYPSDAEWRRMDLRRRELSLRSV